MSSSPDIFSQTISFLSLRKCPKTCQLRNTGVSCNKPAFISYVTRNNKKKYNSRKDSFSDVASSNCITLASRWKVIMLTPEALVITYLDPEPPRPEKIAEVPVYLSPTLCWCSQWQIFFLFFSDPLQHWYKVKNRQLGPQLSDAAEWSCFSSSGVSDAAGRAHSSLILFMWVE